MAGSGARAPDGMNTVQFEGTLAAMHDGHYRHPEVDILKTDCGPGGSVAGFCVVEVLYMFRRTCMARWAA